MTVSSFIPSRFCGILFLGEAPGEQEELVGQPFVGNSGQELQRLCAQAEIPFSECARMNVLSERAPDAKIDNLLVKISEARETYNADALRQEHPNFPWPVSYNWEPLSKAGYIPPRLLGDLARVKQEIESVRPTVICALGNLAIWALLGTVGISKVRGSIAESKLTPGIKVLPTYHPSSLFQNWDNRPVVVADLMKLAREAKFPEIRRPKRQVWIEPTLEDIYEFDKKFLQSADYITYDIEVSNWCISCIGFGNAANSAIVVAFFDKRKPDWNYWPSAREEAAALRWVRDVLYRPVRKIAQNPLYDLQYLYRQWKIAVKNQYHDTMLQHHALQPEMTKSLGFMGSIYTDEISWKLLRSHSETTKREE